MSYDSGTELLLGEIVNVCAEGAILDEYGLIHPSKLRPIIFDSVHDTNLKLSEQVRNAFKDGLKLK